MATGAVIFFSFTSDAQALQIAFTPTAVYIHAATCPFVHFATATAQWYLPGFSQTTPKVVPVLNAPDDESKLWSCPPTRFLSLQLPPQAAAPTRDTGSVFVCAGAFCASSKIRVAAASTSAATS